MVPDPWPLNDEQRTLLHLLKSIRHPCFIEKLSQIFKQYGPKNLKFFKTHLSAIFYFCSSSEKREYLESLSCAPGNYMLWHLLSVSDMQQMLFNPDKKLNMTMLKNC